MTTILTINASPSSGASGFTSTVSGNLSITTPPVGVDGEAVQLQMNTGGGWLPFGPALYTGNGGNYSLSVPWTGMTGSFEIRAYYGGNQARSIYLVETSSESVTITITSGGGGGGGVGPVGIVSDLRIQDVARNVWFSYNGSWDASPSVLPGSGNLHIVFSSVNIGDAAGNLVLTIKSSSGSVLATKTVATPISGTASIDYTGSMPSTNYGVSCTVTP